MKEKKCIKLDPIRLHNLKINFLKITKLKNIKRYESVHEILMLMAYAYTVNSEMLVRILYPQIALRCFCDVKNL